jgi:hypothetical protein
MRNFYIHDGLVFRSRKALDEHAAGCPQCAPFVAAEKAAAEDFGKRLFEHLKAKGLIPQTDNINQIVGGNRPPRTDDGQE